MVWKVKLAGPEQLLLERLFKTGKITKNHTPQHVWKSQKVFLAHGSNTFRTHFNANKKKFGVDVGSCEDSFLFIPS